LSQTHRSILLLAAVAPSLRHRLLLPVVQLRQLLLDALARRDLLPLRVDELRLRLVKTVQKREPACVGRGVPSALEKLKVKKSSLALLALMDLGPRAMGISTL